MEEKIIKSEERVRKYGEVYTPMWLVNKMLDMLEEESPEAFSDIDKTFLEPACGNGNFLIEIFERKLKLCNTYQDGLRALKSITAIDILPDNCEESRERLYNRYCKQFSDGREEAKAILKEQIICGDSLVIMKEWAKEEYMRDLGTLAQSLLDNVKVKPKPDKDGKIVSVIEWHDDCSLADYLKSALETYKNNKNTYRKDEFDNG